MSLVDRSWGQQPICTGPTSVTNLLYDCWPDIHFTSLGLSFFLFYFSLLKKFYVFISQDKRREGERKGEIHQCAREMSIGCLLYTPYWRPGPQPRHVPWQGIELTTFQFAGQWFPTEPQQPGLGLSFYIYNNMGKTLLSPLPK